MGERKKKRRKENVVSIGRGGGKEVAFSSGPQGKEILSKFQGGGVMTP